MPELSRFYGIVIKMFFTDKEHNPPHIHAIYGDYIGEFNILSNTLMVGDLPPKAVKLVNEWIEVHQKELVDIWETQNFRKVAPIE
jgi:hypothetical protein